MTQPGSTRSWALGRGAEVPASTPYRGVMAANRVEVVRASGDIGSTVLSLQDPTGTPHTIGVTPGALTYDGAAVSAVGHIHSISDMPSLQPALNGKANTSHTHDDRYYTEIEVNSLLTGKANTSHTHDDRYYTEAEVDAKLQIGTIHSMSNNQSPAGESLTGVGTYATAGVLKTGTLQSLIPAITSGLWDVNVEASALVYRSVATGGVWLYLGNGSTAITQALGRLSPQTHAYTLNLYGAQDQALLTSLSPSSTLDLRYTGFGTAGTTYVVNHGWKITARRVG